MAGQRFAAELVAAATRQPLAVVTEALCHATRARLIADDGPGRYRFAHDLIREFAYEQAGSVTAPWHERIGLALAQGGQAPAAEVAGHFVQGRPASAQARRYSVAAAREAAGRLAHEEAARHWEGALAATRGRDRVEVLLALGEARWRAGQGQASGEAYTQAAIRAREAGDGRRLARAALGLAELSVAELSLAELSLSEQQGQAALGLGERGQAAPGGPVGWRPGEMAALLSEALEALPAGAGEPAQLRLRVMASLARTLAWPGWICLGHGTWPRRPCRRPRRPATGRRWPPACWPSITRSGPPARPQNGSRSRCGRRAWRPATGRRSSRPGCWPRPTGSSWLIRASGPSWRSSSDWPAWPVSPGSATPLWSGGPCWPCWPASWPRPAG